MSTRIARLCTVLVALLAFALTPTAHALIIQRAGDDYVAWEAEDYTVEINDAWNEVADAAASDGQAMVVTVTNTAEPGAGMLGYDLQFAADGQYRLYFRMASNSSGDSMFRPADFDVDPGYAVSPHLPNTNNVYTWYNDSLAPTTRYVVDPADVTTPNTLQLRVGSREVPFKVDRFVLSKNTSLSDAALDALYNYDVSFTAAQASGAWATATTWDAGTPDDKKVASIGEGHTITLNTAGSIAKGLTIGHDGSIRPGDGSLSQTGGDLTVLGNLNIGINHTNSTTVTGAYAATGGSSLTVGSAADPADLYLGYNTAGTLGDAIGTLDLSGASQFTAHLGKLSLGQVTKSTSTGKGAGTLKLAETNTIYADEILVSWSNMHAATQLQSIVELGTTNTIETDTLTVGGRRGRALMDFAAGGTLTLSGLTRAGTDLRVGYTDLDTGSTGIATMDLTGGTFNATLRDVVVGYHASKTGTDTGTLTFEAGNVEADTLTIGTAGVSSNGKGNGNGTVNMNGGTFTVANTTGIGVGTGNATGILNIAGGTFTTSSLAIGQGATHATYGDGTPTGTVNISGGTAQVNGDLTLGTGTTASTGTLYTTGGTLNVAGDLTGGIGSSTVTADGGTLDVTGDLKVDAFSRVGYNGRTATVTAGGDVEIGASGILDIAYNQNENSVATNGTLDLSDADSVTLDLDQLRIGYMPGSYMGSTDGTLTLSDTGANVINATAIAVGDCRGGTGPYVHGAIHLGADNTINTDTLHVARQKGKGNIDIAPGGTLTLTGLSGASADLYIGYNDQNTTTDLSNGNVNLTGGTFNATLDDLVIGYHLYPWNHAAVGYGRGKLTFNAGAVTANTATIGSGDVLPPDGTYPAPAHGAGIGSLNVNGGTFTATTVDLGVGSSRAVGTINVGGGTFQVNGAFNGGAGSSTLAITSGTANLYGNTSAINQITNSGGTLYIGNSDADTFDVDSLTHNAGTTRFQDGASWHVGGDLTVNSGELDFIDLEATATSKIVDGDLVLNGSSRCYLAATNNGAGQNPALTQAVFDGLLADRVVVNDGAQFRFYISGLALPPSPYIITQPFTITGDATTGPYYAQLGHDIEGGPFPRTVHYAAVTLTNNAVFGMRPADGVGYANLILDSDATVTNDEPGSGGTWSRNDNFTLEGVSSPSGAHTLHIGQTERFSTTLVGTADANTTLDLANADLTLNVAEGGRIDGSVVAQSGSTFRIASGTTTIGGNVAALAGSTVNFTGANVTVAGTLLGDGTVTGPVAVSGMCAPGLSHGILHTGDITLLSGSIFEVEIDGATAGNGAGHHDQLAVTGAVFIDEAWLDIQQLTAPIIGEDLIIISNDGTDPVSGTFLGLGEGGVVPTTYGGQAYGYWISYVGGDGNDVVLTYAPEPGTLALFGLALPALLRRRRRTQ